MLQLDAVQLYDLSEAGRLLFRDPARLAREARLRRVPAARAEGQLGLPTPWVDAESGASASDPEALRRYWLGRLEPPSREARRPVRDRARLDVETLLTPEEAAARVFADAAGLMRLDLDGTLPALRVDGQPVYDATLADLVARAEEGEAVRREADARRGEVIAWTRYEYETLAPAPAAPAAGDEPESAPTGEASAASEAPPPASMPAAYQIPKDLGLEAIEPLPPKPSTLIEADGFETVDED